MRLQINEFIKLLSAISKPPSPAQILTQQRTDSACFAAAAAIAAAGTPYHFVCHHIHCSDNPPKPATA